MKKNLVKIAMIGLAAGLCVSAKAIPAKKAKDKKNQEVAMVKCSKDEKRKSDASCGNKDGDCGCNGLTSAGRNGYTLDSFQPEKSDIAAKRKSAAQKVLEGY